MSKFPYSNYNRWQQFENSRTSASLIVNPTAPLSPTTRPRLKLDDLLMNRQGQVHRQNAEEEPKRSFYRPLVASEVREQIHSKFSPLATGRTSQLEPDTKLNHLGSQSKILGVRSQRKEGELVSYKSQKSLPTFMRNRDRQVERNKAKGLSKENFKIIKRLGEGRFGTVFLAREIHTQLVFALKVMNKQKIIQDNLLGQFIRELKIQSFLEHPNIIRCYGYFSDQQNFYAILELGCDGQLYDIISSGATLSQESTSFIVGNLLDAIALMHKYKILHRDIKPENVVLIHGNVKLCDFGWAVHKKQELRSTFCGTPLYLSPELLQGQRYDEKVDLWAIGILAYELHLGCSPFDINEQEDLLRIVLVMITDQVSFPRKVSPEFRQFITQILKKNPKERLASKDLLKLEFIQKYKELDSCQELCQ